MSGIHLLMINPNDGSQLVPEDVFRYNVPDKFQMGKQRLSGEVIECSLKELTGVDETFMICQVCSEIISEPVTLPCLHTFCDKCLILCVCDYGKVCPLCKQDFECPGADLALLPKNSFIHHYLTIAIAAQEIDTAACKICSLIPDDYCLDCSAYLCELCSIVCHKMNGKDGHDVMRLLKYKKMIGQKRPECVDHDDLATNFCDSCKVLVCKKCLRDGHNQHSLEDVQSGITYFKITTNGLVKRYPYEDSLLYWTRKAKGLPLKGKEDTKRLEAASSKPPVQKCCKKTLSLEEIEQLKIKLANNALPSRLSPDKTVRISTFQTEDMDWEVYVPVVPPPPQSASRFQPPIDDGTKILAELLNKSVVDKLGDSKDKEQVETSKPQAIKMPEFSDSREKRINKFHKFMKALGNGEFPGVESSDEEMDQDTSSDKMYDENECKPESDWSKKKLRLYDYPWRKNSTAPFDKSIKHYPYCKDDYAKPPKLSKLNSSDINFDDVD
ncbi:tripartite motif-containing protein 42-like isoform X2 [Anneissia japonica]|nr:tripartite motif-containing protein 42-like isoform X2 [Anneissia japonica]XP_033122787.1 tripartite motif-containing protein 42-like isoform X2 [Anneissia japonica]